MALYAPDFGIDKSKGEDIMAFNARVQLKNDTSTNWSKATTFKPLAGEVLVYDAGTSAPKLKVGDGTRLASALPFVGDDKVDKVSGKGLSTNDFTAAYKSKLDGIANGANAYTHPSYTSKASGLYKVTVDSTGHVSATAAVAKSDITGLGIPAQDTTYSAATTSAAGLMSAADKSKLDGIASGANNYTYTLPTASSSTLGGVKVGSNISLSSGTISLTKANVTSALGYTPPTTNTTYGTMGGASASAAGTSGLVPAPSAGAATRYLRSDGTWATPPDTNTTYSAATTTAAGLMSASDKSKLDGIASGANNYTYTLPTASSSTLGGVKVGSNITLSSGVISLTKDNVTSALGYTPPTTNTTYSAATTSAAGLMSASDKSKLDGITASADSVSFTQTQTSGTAVGTLTINGTSTTLYAPAGTANALTSSSVIDGGSW